MAKKKTAECGEPWKDPSLFERLKNSLEEGIRFAEGELTLRTTEMPDRPPAWEAREIQGLRKTLQMSQGVFARLLNVSLKTVQSWEQGERQPSQAASRLLQVLKGNPKVVCGIVGFRLRRGPQVAAGDGRR